MTFGELIFSPTATNFVADLAPADKRGRYLGLYGLIWYVATATGPLGAGFLSDKFGHQTPWLAGAVLALLALIGFLWLDKRYRNRDPRASAEPEHT
jgi:MFS family permease